MIHIDFLRAWMTRRMEMYGLSDERGEVAEKVIIIAVFAGLAISVGAIIVAKVMTKAGGIALD
jgi:hypothetical protein